jgi:hypothetical protein
MAWPTSSISTSNLDQGTDSPALARSQIKSTVDNVNSIAAEFGNVDTTGRSTNDVLTWDGAKWVAAAAAAGSTYTDANVVTLMSGFGSNVIVTTGNITGGNIIGNGSSLTNTPEKTITLTGDATASGSTGSNVSVTLANTAVTAGTYGSATEVAQITVDSKGRVTSAANVTITGGGSGSTSMAILRISGVGTNVVDNTYRRGVTESSDPSNIVSISSNVMTLGAGTYFIELTPTYEADTEATMSFYNETADTSVANFGEYREMGTSGNGLFFTVDPPVIISPTGSTNYSFRQNTAASADRNVVAIVKIFKLA